MANICAALVFVSTWILPQQRSIDLHGEGVVFKRGDLTEYVRQDQIDKGDGDGGEVLNKQTDHPVVLTLKDADPGPGKETLKPRNISVKYANSPTHPIDTSTDRKIDEVEGSAQQSQDEDIESKPQQVKPHLLSQLPLSHLHGEPLLLQEQLSSIRRGGGKTGQLKHNADGTENEKIKS